MTREEAILEMWTNFNVTVMHTSATPEERTIWELGFVEAMGVLGVRKDELDMFLL